MSRRVRQRSGVVASTAARLKLCLLHATPLLGSGWRLLLLGFAWQLLLLGWRLLLLGWRLLLFGWRLKFLRWRLSSSGGG